MARMPSQRRWSGKVTETSDALDLEDNISSPAVHGASPLRSNTRPSKAIAGRRACSNRRCRC
jgi:hypothetical protein